MFKRNSKEISNQTGQVVGFKLFQNNLKFKFKHLKCIISKLYIWKIAFIHMDIITVIIIIEEMQQNLRYFNLKFKV